MDSAHSPHVSCAQMHPNPHLDPGAFPVGMPRRFEQFTRNLYCYPGVFRPCDPRNEQAYQGVSARAVRLSVRSLSSPIPSTIALPQLAARFNSPHKSPGSLSWRCNGYTLIITVVPKNQYRSSRNAADILLSLADGRLLV